MGLCPAQLHRRSGLFALYIYSGKSHPRGYRGRTLTISPPELQFDAVENGLAITKLMQIFSRQAPMMDALLAHFAEQMRRRREGIDGQPPEHSGPDGTDQLYPQCCCKILFSFQFAQSRIRSRTTAAVC